MLDVVFFPEVGGSTLDSHHGFVVEYGMDRDVELGRFFSPIFFISNYFLSTIKLSSSLHVHLEIWLQKKLQ